MSPLIITLGLVEFLVQRKKTFFLQPTLLLIIKIYEIEKILKGLCHEMNNLFDGPKSQINTLCICADGLRFPILFEMPSELDILIRLPVKYPELVSVFIEAGKYFSKK